MAKFQSELPNELIQDFEELGLKCDVMFGEMCKEGAKVVYSNVKANMEKSFDTTNSLDKGLKVTRVYKTPSDDGTNVHVGFYGYTEDGTPIPLIAQAREYGTSRGEAKKPFFRKSFKKKEIEEAMQKVQDKYIKGD